MFRIKSNSLMLRKRKTTIIKFFIYIMYPQHSCDYLKKISIKTNMATDEGNSRNET